MRSNAILNVVIAAAAAAYKNALSQLNSTQLNTNTDRKKLPIFEETVSCSIK